MADRAHLERLTRELTEQGRLIEAGWNSLRLTAVSADAGPEQLQEMRQAFFAGSLHVWTSIMTMMDPGDEPTDADLRRMSQIEDELEAFGQTLLANIATQGRA